MDESLKTKLPFFILRVSVGIAFVLFGIGKFTNDAAAQAIRETAFFQALPLATNVWIYLAGVIQIVTGTGLITGFFSRICAGMAFVQLTGVLYLLNFRQAGDIGLAGAAFYLTLTQDHSFSMAVLLRKKETTE